MNGTARRRKQNGHAANGDRYAVEYVPIDSIMPSPENDQLYGEIQLDESFQALIDSIKRKGLDEPILVTEDRFILSGHRRYHAVKEYLRWSGVKTVTEEGRGDTQPQNWSPPAAP